MSFTLRNMYSKVALGQLKATKGFLSALNGRFPFPSNVPAQNAGTVVLEMWDTFTGYTPTSGSLPSSGGNNVLVTASVGTRAAEQQKTEQQKNAMEFEDTVTMVEQMADYLYYYLEGLVLAALVAATPGFTATLATGYIDFLIPSAATQPDVIKNTAAAVNYVIEQVRIRNGGNQDLVIVGDAAAVANLKSIANNSYTPGNLTVDPNGQARWDGIPIWPVSGITSFGGASNECLYIVGGRGFALAYDTPYPFYDGDGWGKRPEGIMAFDLMLPYCYGLAQAQLFGSIINPAS